jgi:hypothetical protein
MRRTGPVVHGVPGLKSIPLVRAIPILVVVIAAFVAGMAWAISSPIGSSPDEDYHLASIWCPPPVETSGCQVLPGVHGNEITVGYRVIAAPACFAFHADESAACIWKIPADKLGQDDRFDRGDYPGGFYHVMHVFAQGDPYSTIYRIRAFNLAIAILLGALIVLAAARPTRRILAYAVVSTFVPMGMFLVPSANPSSWAIVGVAVAGFGLHSYWMAETRGLVIANAAIAAVGVALAVSSRGDSALYAILTAVALTALHFRSVRRHPVRLVLPLLGMLVGFFVYRSSGQATSAMAGSGLGPANSLHGWDLFLYNLMNSPVLLFGNQGLYNLGWLDTPLPSIVWVPMILVCGFLIMAGVSRPSWMKMLVLVGGILAVVAIPLFVLQVSQLKVGAGVQSRYMLPLLPVVALVLLTGRLPDQAVRLSRPAAWVTWALVSLANCVSLLTNIRRYTTGLDGSILPSGTPEWWSTSLSGPPKTWVIGSLAFAVAAWMVVRLSSGSDLPTPVASAADERSARAVEASPKAGETDTVTGDPVTADPVAAEPAAAEPTTAETSGGRVRAGRAQTPDDTSRGTAT